MHFVNTILSSSSGLRALEMRRSHNFTYFVDIRRPDDIMKII